MFYDISEQDLFPGIQVEAHMGPSEKAVLSHRLTQWLQTICVGASVPFNPRMERGPVTKNAVFLHFIADDEAKKKSNPNCNTGTLIWVSAW
jgi:hypothetical protein